MAISRALVASSSQSAAALEEISASMEEISSQVQLNAQGAQQALNLVDESQRVLNRSQQDMESLLGSISHLVAESGKVKNIATTIDEIAFQTNLLALNAAVEAARAGEQGRGFAVVADAVRALAQKSMTASNEISNLIETITQGVLALGHLGTQTRDSLNLFVESQSKVSTLTQENAGRSQEQAKGVEQVTQALQEVDHGVQSLAKSGQELNQTVLQFQGIIHDLLQARKELALLAGQNQVESETQSPPKVTRPMQEAA